MNDILERPTKLLIVDSTKLAAEHFCQDRILSLGKRKLEQLRLLTKVCGEQGYLERIHEVDVVILGPALNARAVKVGHKIMGHCPWIYLVVVADQRTIDDGVFVDARKIGIWKLFAVPTSVDLLQELEGICVRIASERNSEVLA